MKQLIDEVNAMKKKRKSGRTVSQVSRVTTGSQDHNHYLYKFETIKNQLEEISYEAKGLSNEYESEKIMNLGVGAESHT